jgi:FKBP-type peptidyl-prolyl cis-trans isomerase
MWGHISEAQMRDHIFGVAPCNDVSERAWQKSDLQRFRDTTLMTGREGATVRITPRKGTSMRLMIAAVALAASAAAVAAQTGKVLPAPPDVAEPPKDALKTSTGLASKVLTPGTGKTRPGRTDLVTVHYTGWTTDGKMFDSSVARGAPATFPLDRVIAGWTEGLQLMVSGETRRLWIPEALAYRGTRDPRGMLVFDVELISFTTSPTQAPPDVKAPPSDAKKTPSGLAYKVLQAGAGTRRPSAKSEVTVHYSGWTTDGRLFDSSVARGQPATFTLDGVIAGWTEGVQLMVEGEKTRFWIPEKLAYRGESPPFGMLVFDVELVSVR